MSTFCEACQVERDDEGEFGTSYLGRQWTRLNDNAHEIETTNLLIAAALIDVVAQLSMIRSELQVLALSRHTCVET